MLTEGDEDHTVIDFYEGAFPAEPSARQDDGHVQLVGGPTKTEETS